MVGDSQTGERDKIDGPYSFFKLIQRMRQMLPPWMPSIGIECPRLPDYAYRLWDDWERNLDPDLFIDRTLKGKVKGKAALDAWTRRAAPEFIDVGVTFIAINMPLVRTPMIALANLMRSVHF